MDSIFIFGLALILFGPKKLPEIGRQIGKIVLEFRKASNEFKMQIEDELRASEQAERQKKVEAETKALTAGVIPVGAAVETSTPSELTIQPPTVGEQVSSAPPFRTGSEQLAAVIVNSPGEDPNPDAIAEIYSTVGDPGAESMPDRKTATVAAEEIFPANLEPLSGRLSRENHVPETGINERDQATTHHG